MDGKNPRPYRSPGLPNSMNNIHDFDDYDSFDCLTVRTYIINQAVDRSDRTPEKMATRKKTKKEMTMRSHGHATVWGTHSGVGHTKDAKCWYQQLKEWWAAHNAARRQQRLAALHACWDARHEAVRPLRAEAAPEMAAAQGALTVATILYGLSQ
jgi:hypothetical protein